MKGKRTMSKAGETGDTAVMVATRTISGGFLGLNSTLTVQGDGTLRLSDRRFNTNETRKVSRSRVRSLQAELSKPEWQEVEPFYGQPVFDGFTETIEGGGKRTDIASPSVEPVTIPPILGEVLGRLHNLWPAADPLTTDEVVTEPPGSSEANLFELEGEGVQIIYGILRRRREFLDYRDEQHDLTFSGEKGEIGSLESGIGRMVTVTLEILPDSYELTLTLVLPQINLGGKGSSFESLAIRTRHLSSIGGSTLVKGSLQTYDVLPLRGRASQAD
jgi:hypothetical protein